MDSPRRYKIFVSSPQTEFASVRRDLCYFILTDPYLKEYFDVFLFENLPASAQSPVGNYRSHLASSTIYLGLFGKTYGTVQDSGFSATELEYNYASELGLPKLVFLKQLTPAAGRHQAERMKSLIERARQEVTYDTFESIFELKQKVLSSLLYWQQTHRHHEST
jgi:ATP-dependent DNA helicase RecG